MGASTDPGLARIHVEANGDISPPARVTAMIGTTEYVQDVSCQISMVGSDSNAVELTGTCETHDSRLAGPGVGVSSSSIVPIDVQLDLTGCTSI